MANNQGLYYYTKEEIDELLGQHYSTTEQVAGTWIDGSTIYCQTINFGALPNATSKPYIKVINNIKSLIKIEGFAVSSTGTATLPLPYATPADLSSCVSLSASITSTAAQPDIKSIMTTIRTGSDRSSYTGYVTVYYTKEEAS